MSDNQADANFDAARAEAFAGRFMGALNDAALCLMMSIGHRTGLFDRMRDLPPSTSEEIAERAGLNERYVREWLAAMTTGGVVELDASSGRFRLPAEHAAFLTRAAAADNMAVFTQYFSQLGSVEDDIVECFKKGGGVPYDKYPRFHEVMEEDSGLLVLPSLESHILPLVKGLQQRLMEGIRVLDLGCGRGRVMNRLAELFPNSRFVGKDFSSEAIETANGEAAAKKLSNAAFECADLSNYHTDAEADTFDLVTTFDAIHDQAQPLNVLKGIHRTLKQDGTYLMQDIGASSHLHENLDHPAGTLLYTISCLHCMTVSLAQKGEGLGAMWGEQKTRDYLKQAGFNSIETNKLAHDPHNYWYVIHK